MIEDVVTVATFSTASEAEAAKLDLEAEGIRVVIGDMDWTTLGIPTAHVKLEVKQEDAARAAELLAHHGHTLRNDDDEDANVPDNITCLECGQEMSEGQTKCQGCGWSYGG